MKVLCYGKSESSAIQDSHTQDRRYSGLLDQQVIEGSISGKVAEKVRIGNEVDYSGLKVFGCPTYVHIPSEE
jgi:hypothetical protein